MRCSCIHLIIFTDTTTGFKLKYYTYFRAKTVQVSSHANVIVFLCETNVCYNRLAYRKNDWSRYSRNGGGGGGSVGGGGPAERKSSDESDDCSGMQIEYATSTMRKRGTDKMTVAARACGGGGKSMDYDVCPYATFSVLQNSSPTGGGGRRTPTHHHRALSQTDCYETPGHDNHRGLIDKSYGKRCDQNEGGP